MYLGVEIGGTKLQLGVGDGLSANLIELVRMDVDPGDRAPELLGKIASAAKRLIAAHKVQGIGVGFGGPVDTATGTIIKSHHVDSWENFGLADWCATELGLSAVVGNDCDVAALAEAKHGAGRGRAIVLYVTVGTGVGGGLVVDGRPYARHRTASAELGHLRPGIDAVDPSNTVEARASGPGIVASARRRIATSRDLGVTADFLEAAGSAPSLESLTARDVAFAALAGHPIGVAAFEAAATTLGWAIAQAITLTSAEVVVIGGGVSLADEAVFLNPLIDQVARFVYPPLRDAYEIVPAALGEQVVVHGGVLKRRMSDE